MPEPPWLSQDQPQLIYDLLSTHQLIDGETIRAVSIAGEGNMNVTLRVVLQGDASDKCRSLIVKQSRPFVAKYDSIPAPLERIEFESKFYDSTAPDDELSAMMPRQIAWLPDEKVLILEDLGAAADGSNLYNAYPAREMPNCIEPLLQWLALLHERTRHSGKFAAKQNLELRKLNHEHIFLIPFQDPATIDLDSVCPGLQDGSLPVRTNRKLISRVMELGQEYLADGDCLLHGDFYPGSWLMTESGPKVIDPEFSFWGPAEFDLGVLLGHLHLIGVDEPYQYLQTIWSKYYSDLDEALIRAFAATEILRRILGVAQLPLSCDLAARLELVNASMCELV